MTLRWLVPGVTAAIIVTVFIAPFGAFVGAEAVTEAVRHAFRYLCHQRVERALMFAGVPMPLCARCFAIYAGCALTGMTLLWLRPNRLLLLWSLGAVAASAFIIAMEVALEAGGLLPSHAGMRVLSGALFGSAAAWLSDGLVRVSEN